MYQSIIFLPLLASILALTTRNCPSRGFASYITTFSILLSALISSHVLYKVGLQGEIIHIKLCNWLSVYNFHVDWALYVDSLTAIMLFVITSVSAVVHIYSIGYMHDDPNISRFMGYLSLFTVCMLFLVTSDNFIQLFFGWEGVGLCSYLLIGFWHKKDSANFAATKAFVVNRVGDLALMFGIITIYYHFGSVEFDKVFQLVSNYTNITISFFGFTFNSVEFIAFLLFIGCMGKSAQIGLHVWLPDAMEGPTPVSALIHAATMVTAGVFLLARCSYIFEYTPHVREFIVVIGATTCIFASLVAICQNDIKKIIAYSTCSQLGYMFIACGLSVYQAGIFHLFTHAFFKAMLFLAAGSVIHAIHEQDINKMGALRKFMPITYALFWLGSLSIMGIFPFSGYYSKDEILMAAYLDKSFAGNFAFIMGIIAAFCTAIYSIKIIVKVFHGKSHIKSHDHISESGVIMNAPLMFLAFCAIFAGMIAFYLLDICKPEYGFFRESLFFNEINLGEHAPFFIEILPMLVAVAGMIVGYITFSTNLSKSIAKTLKPLHRLIEKKFYFDEFYEYFVVQTNDLIAHISKFFDKNIIDFLLPNLASYLSLYYSNKLSDLHNGSVNRYAIIFVFSLVVGLSIIVYEFVL